MQTIIFVHNYLNIYACILWIKVQSSFEFDEFGFLEIKAHRPYAVHGVTRTDDDHGNT